MDIVVEEESSRNGFLAVHEEEYAETLHKIIREMTDEGRDAVRERAKSSVERFSEREFEVGWLRATEPVMAGLTRR